MLRPDAAAVVREVARGANVYILAHVLDDIGEATVRGALEAGGLIGISPGQVPRPLPCGGSAALHRVHLMVLISAT